MTEIKLYNTLTRKKETFAPIDAENVRMYVCGPTVYDYAHIGNARPVIVFDVLFRLLRHVYGNDQVTYVRNITDVDDKINARALETHGAAIGDGSMTLNEAIREVTEKTASQYQSDMKALGCLEPTHQPRATEFVLPRADGKADMASMIQTLINKGHAYVAKGAQGREVLFRVNSMEDYGQLSNRKLEDQQAGARIAVESHKENPGDFVLWKESSETEPGWDGVFDGETIHGRPGWHIECSAMSEAYLGKTFDIHGGGLDLIFPHHENEIAQSRCCHDSDAMANIWMHNGFLQVEGEKMSKSLGNFHTVHDVLETDKVGGRSWPGEVVRLAMLMTHYREPIDFTVRRLKEAQSIWKKWSRFKDEVVAGKSLAEPDFEPSETHLDKILERTVANDLNFSEFINQMEFLLVTATGRANLIVDDDKNYPEIVQRAASEAAANALSCWSRLGFEFQLQESDITIDVQSYIDKRLAYIVEKNWAEADRIRDELLEQGIQLKDGKDPETGERITSWEVK